MEIPSPLWDYKSIKIFNVIVTIFLIFPKKKNQKRFKKRVRYPSTHPSPQSSPAAE
jgi:hypothetical protein